MPFNSLTEPTVLKPLTHLETDDLVTKLHEVIKNRQVCLLELAIVKVTLDYVSRSVPLLLLTQKLTFFELGNHRVFDATRTQHPDHVSVT